MFVPRALRLKGVKETQKRKPAGSDVTEASSDDALVQAMQNASTNSAAPSPAAQEEDVGNKTKNNKGPKGSKPGATATTPEYLAQLVAGMELIFTDYAHQDDDGARWLVERYRTVDSEEKYIHLTAILDHPNLATLKPQATQPLLRHALQEFPSPTLDLSPSGFYVRRRPSTYPAPFVPPNSFSVVDNDSGLSFWDQRTIYVEPHIRHLCKTPAKVAHWLKEHGQLRAKWLPVQAVHTLYNSCAFVVLSGNVMHEDQWGKWRAAGKPDDWRVMTKAENLKRTEEYEALVRESKAQAARQRGSSNSIGEAAKQRRISESVDEEGGQSGEQNALVADAVGSGEQAASKKKKRKRTKPGTGTADAEADIQAGGAELSGDGDRGIKRRA
jgi:hypothetical protein